MSESKKASYYICIALVFIFSILLFVASIKSIKALPKNSYYELSEAVKLVKRTYIVQLIFGIVIFIFSLIGMFVIRGRDDGSVPGTRFISSIMLLLAAMFLIQMLVLTSKSTGTKDKSITASIILLIISLVVFLIALCIGGEGSGAVGAIGVLFLVIANLVGTDFSLSTNIVDVLFYIVNAGALAFYISPDKAE